MLTWDAETFLLCPLPQNTYVTPAFTEHFQAFEYLHPQALQKHYMDNQLQSDTL